VEADEVAVVTPCSEGERSCRRGSLSWRCRRKGRGAVRPPAARASGVRGRARSHPRKRVLRREREWRRRKGACGHMRERVRA